jgi:hypothetical protein
VGFTEAGLVFMLGWLGLDIPTASAATLLFRLINYWSIVVFGFVVFYIMSPNTTPQRRDKCAPYMPVKIHRFFTGQS